MKHKRILTSVAMAALVHVSLCAVGVSALSVSAAQGSNSNVKAPTIVGAPVGSGAPGVCTVDGKGLFLFIRNGTDNALYMKTSTDGVTWSSTSTYLGGILAAAPSATATNNGVIEVFVRGTDGHLYAKTSTDSGKTWSPNWTYLGGALLDKTAPSACSWLVGSVVHTTWFVTGTDRGCWYQTETGTPAKNNAWHGLGGKLASSPAATALSDGSQIGLFVVGTDNSVYYKHLTGSTWTPNWAGLSGKVLAGTSPAAYNFATAQIGWFVTGTDSNLYRNWVGSSSGYEQINGALTSSPAAIATTGNTISVFARISSGGTASLSQIDYSSGLWGTWTAIAF
jgi:hypothetical protein